MKPMSPDERELEDLRSGLSGHYREGSTEVPPAHLDAAVLAAARREVARSRFRRNWHLPASIAAVLVIGVSLALMTVDIEEDALPPVDRLAGIAAHQATAPELAMKQESEVRPAPRPALEREETRPSRERRVRGENEADVPQKLAAGKAESAAGAPSVAAPAPAPALQQFEIAAPAEPVGEQKSVLADAAHDRTSGALRKEAAPSSAVPLDAAEEWLKNIQDLLRKGETARAREQLAEFRKRYPDYRVPETLRGLEAPGKPDPQ